MSENPGPSSSTTTRVTPSRSPGVIFTRQTVASGASSQAFCTSSFTSIQGSRSTCSSRIPSVEMENRSCFHSVMRPPRTSGAP